MSYADDFAGIYKTVSSFPVFSDHEHHHPDGFFKAGMDLRKVIENSYVAWIVDGGIDKIMADRAAFFDAVKYNSYFQWLEKGVQQVHGIDTPLGAETWDKISAVIAASHADGDFHWRSLLDNKYDTIVLDAYWDPGSNDNHPEIFASTFRVDKLSYGHHRDAAAVECGPLFDQSLLYPWKHYGFTGKTLSDYVDMAQSLIGKLHREGKIVALKTAIAYNRSVDFYPDDREAAERAFGKNPAEIPPRELTLFGNYVFHRCFEVAAKFDIPVQVHTGLADLRGSDPMLVEPLLRQYPNVRFVLFHSGYPWTSQVAALAHNFFNAYPSLTWMPLISTAAAIRTLDEYIDVAPSINTITWGGDSWVPEESVGAQLAWRFVVASVLTRRYRDGMLAHSELDVLAEKLMLSNGRQVYLRKN